MRDLLDDLDSPSGTLGRGSTTSPVNEPDLHDGPDNSKEALRHQGQEPAAGDSSPVETPNYPPWWLDAIKSAKAVSEALSACQTPSEVDACAKEYAGTYKALDANPKTKIFAIHIKNLADVMRGPKPLPKLFPKLNDQALEAAGREWPAMKSSMLQSEDDQERMFYFSYAKKMENPEWSPSPKQAAHIKRIHMGWQVVEQGVVE